MKAVAIVWTTLFFACNNAAFDTGNSGSGSAVSVFAPAPIISAQIHPANLTLVIVPALTCSPALSVSTAFDLVVVSPASSAFSLDRVTLRLIDGSTIGGSPVSFPRQALDAMFGSTLVAGRRSFAFHPLFGCTNGRPQSIFADVVLVDTGGAIQNATATASFP
jgi:hypothetical protein